MEVPEPHSTSIRTSSKPDVFERLDVNTSTIRIGRRLGEGVAGVVYEAIVPSISHYRVALKVFEPWKWTRPDYNPWKYPKGLSPFQRERLAYKIILSKTLGEEDIPIVRAFGHFELPKGFIFPRYKVRCQDQVLRFKSETLEEPRRVIVKEYIRGAHLDYHIVPPQQMIMHRQRLNRCKIFDDDIRADNFMAGKLVDLSATYYLPHVKPFTLKRLDLEKQIILVKAMILKHEEVDTSYGPGDETT